VSKKDPDDEVPPPPEIVESIRKAAKEGRVIFTDTDKVDEYPNEVRMILTCMGIKDAWVSNLSSVGDFMVDTQVMAQLADMCHCDVDDDSLLWELAQNMRRKLS
jgi:hypothetical protein